MILSGKKIVHNCKLHLTIKNNLLSIATTLKPM